MKIPNEQGYPIGAGITYSKLVHKTTERIIQLVPSLQELQELRINI